jgi:hypothetical protein
MSHGKVEDSTLQCGQGLDGRVRPAQGGAAPVNSNLSPEQFDPETPKRFADLINSAGVDIPAGGELDRFHDLNRELASVDPEAHQALRGGIRRWGSMGGAASLREDGPAAHILRETIAAAGEVAVPLIHRGQTQDHEGLGGGVRQFSSGPRSYSTAERVAEKFARTTTGTPTLHHVQGPVRGLDLRAIQGAESEVILGGGRFEVDDVQRGPQGRLDAFMRQAR